jgi:hypothetical protein
VTNFANSNALPIKMIGSTEAGKIVTSPVMENHAAMLLMNAADPMAM